MKTAKELKDKWEELLNERSNHGKIIDYYKIHPVTTIHEKNSLRFAKKSWEHLSAWMQALEFAMS